MSLIAYMYLENFIQCHVFYSLFSLFSSLIDFIPDHIAKHIKQNEHINAIVDGAYDKHTIIPHRLIPYTIVSIVCLLIFIVLPLGFLRVLLLFLT